MFGGNFRNFHENFSRLETGENVLAHISVGFCLYGSEEISYFRKFLKFLKFIRKVSIDECHEGVLENFRSPKSTWNSLGIKNSQWFIGEFWRILVKVQGIPGNFSKNRGFPGISRFFGKNPKKSHGFSKKFRRNHRFRRIWTLRLENFQTLRMPLPQGILENLCFPLRFEVRKFSGNVHEIF